MINQGDNQFIEIENIEKNHSEKKIRYNILDNFKGILIFLVVFAHFLFEHSIHHKKSFINKIVNYIYIFHMPSFIFCSGFFSKSENSRSFIALSKLILIYLIFNFSHGYILYLYRNEKFRLLFPYNSYWYLLSIIYWRFSIKYLANQYCSISISFIISILIGFWREITSEFSLNRTFSFFPYFLIGYKFSKDNFHKILENRKHFKIIIYSLFFIFLLFSIKFFPNIELSHSMMDSSYKNYKKDIKIRIKLFIFSFIYIILIILVLPNIKLPFITKIGKNSLFIYTFHRIITIILPNKIFSKSQNDSYIILYYLLFSIIICFIFGSKYFTNIMNLFINYVHENLKGMKKKGKIIGLFFSFSFISILMIEPFQINKGKSKNKSH